MAVAEEVFASEKSCPWPVSATVCGLLVALSVTVRVPFLVPLAVGSKKTLMVQLVPAATLLPHALTTPKSLGMAVTLVIVSAVLPVLVRVTLCGRPDVPTY